MVESRSDTVALWFGALEECGGFFVADVHEPGALPHDRWRSFRGLLADPEPLDRRVGQVRTSLAAGGLPIRVSGSVAQLGLLTRILAPAIAVASLGLGSVSLNLDDVWWQDDLSAVFPLSITSSVQPNWPGAVTENLVALFESRYGVPETSLWGNVGSVANGAAQQLARTQPAIAPRAWPVADAILADARIESGSLRSGQRFRRRSCCLLYQAAGTRAAICGVCVLTG